MNLKIKEAIDLFWIKANEHKEEKPRVYTFNRLKALDHSVSFYELEEIMQYIDKLKR